MRLPSQPGVIVDAGAYTGLSAVYFTLRYPEARIIALEPSGSNFELLQRNTQHLSNVQAVNAALWAKSGPITLTDSSDGAWAFRVSGDLDVRSSPDSVMAGSAPEVAATTVPDVMADFQIPRINLLKMDIEGSELEVFENSENWVNSVDAIFIELHDRFKPGCSRAFFKAVDEFTVKAWRGQTVMVARAPSGTDPR